MDRVEEASHVVYPAPPPSPPDVEYLRPLDVRGKSVLVHWWYFPDRWEFKNWPEILVIMTKFVCMFVQLWYNCSNCRCCHGDPWSCTPFSQAVAGLGSMAVWHGSFQRMDEWRGLWTHSPGKSRELAPPLFTHSLCNIELQGGQLQLMAPHLGITRRTFIKTPTQSDDTLSQDTPEGGTLT